jgi:hypothetical protein
LYIPVRFLGGVSVLIGIVGGGDDGTEKTLRTPKTMMKMARAIIIEVIFPGFLSLNFLEAGIG